MNAFPLDAWEEVEYRLSQVVDAYPLPMFILDADHKITHWNKACADLSGVGTDQMVGTRDPWRLLHPTARPVLADLVLDGIRPRGSSDGIESYSEERERWFSITAFPLFDLRGRLTGALQLLRDIPAKSRTLSGSENTALRSALVKALDRQEFSLLFQPKGRLPGGEITGFEALLRWNHWRIGAVPPDKFIPLLEESGQIIEIGEWVIAQSLRQALRWREKGVRAAVNISACQLWQPDLPEKVASLLAEQGADPGCLELEITESMLMEHPEEAIRTLRALAAMGVHLSLDDFGTGYSSLSYLKRFPIHTIKVDRSFISDLTTNRDDLEIVRAIITMGHSLGRRIIAEGVETEEQRQILKELGCDEIQGYLLSPPLAEAEFAAFMLGAGQT